MLYKKLIGLMTTVVVIALLSTGIIYADQRRGKGKYNETPVNRGDIQALINKYPVKSLDKSEIKGILQMREEEKLARDVYNYLYSKWNLRIFSNIARAEETHMNAVGLLIERYKLEDPIKNDIPGKFENSALQDIYNELIKEGSKSLIDALKVGATVEDLDIKDLEDLIKKTDNNDIKIVYQNLDKGSRNHLRAFYSQLKKNGATYKAQYITQDYLNRIISSPRETGKQITDPDYKF